MRLASIHFNRPEEMMMSNEQHSTNLDTDANSADAPGTGSVWTVYQWMRANSLPPTEKS
jgi:hypothetical protein